MNSKMNELIRTGNKNKLPKGWSYPIGAELISKLLIETDQYSKMCLFFRDRDQYWKSAFTKKVKEKGEIKVFEIHDSYLDVSKHDYSLYIYAVPSEKRYDTKQQFEKRIIPLLLKYLHQSRIEKNNSLFFQAFLNLKTGEIRIRVQ